MIKRIKEKTGTMLHAAKPASSKHFAPNTFPVVDTFCLVRQIQCSKNTKSPLSNRSQAKKNSTFAVIYCVKHH